MLSLPSFERQASTNWETYTGSIPILHPTVLKQRLEINPLFSDQIAGVSSFSSSKLWLDSQASNEVQIYPYLDPIASDQQIPLLRFEPSREVFLALGGDHTELIFYDTAFKFQWILDNAKTYGSYWAAYEYAIINQLPSEWIQGDHNYDFPITETIHELRLKFQKIPNTQRNLEQAIIFIRESPELFPLLFSTISDEELGRLVEYLVYPGTHRGVQILYKKSAEFLDLIWQNPFKFCDDTSVALDNTIIPHEHILAIVPLGEFEQSLITPD